MFENKNLLKIFYVTDYKFYSFYFPNSELLKKKSYNLKTDVYKELRLREMQNFVCMDRRQYRIFATCNQICLVVWEISVKS